MLVLSTGIVNKSRLNNKHFLIQISRTDFSDSKPNIITIKI